MQIFSQNRQGFFGLGTKKTSQTTLTTIAQTPKTQEDKDNSVRALFGREERKANKSSFDVTA